MKLLSCQATYSLKFAYMFHALHLVIGSLDFMSRNFVSSEIKCKNVCASPYNRNIILRVNTPKREPFKGPQHVCIISILY